VNKDTVEALITPPIALLSRRRKGGCHPCFAIAMPPAKRTRGGHDEEGDQKEGGEEDEVEVVVKNGSDDDADAKATEPLDDDEKVRNDQEEEGADDHPDRKKPKLPSVSSSSAQQQSSAVSALRSSLSIPASQHYHVSFMHADVLTAAVASPKHGYVITASRDGVVKFWKRLKIEEADSVSAGSAPTLSAAQQQQQQLQHPCLEFVKSFTAHAGAVQALAIDATGGGNGGGGGGGDVCCSVGTDSLLKWYDVATFDVITMVRSPHPLGAACCALPSSSGGSAGGVGGSGLLWAVSSANSGAIYIFSVDAIADQDFDGPDEDETDDPKTGRGATSRNLVATVTLHGPNRVTTLTSIPGRNAVLSTDEKGIVEVWSTAGPPSSIGQACTSAHNGIAYRSKFDTDLYELVKRKTHGVSAAATRDHYALYGHDGKIRIYGHATGKIVAKLDERLATYEKQQGEYRQRQDETVQQNGVTQLDALEFGRRAAVEREIRATSIMTGRPSGDDESSGESAPEAYQRLSIQFDPTGTYLLIPTMLGIKVVDWKRRKLCFVLGGADASQLRFVGVCLCHGDAKINKQMDLARMSAAASSGGTSASAGVTSNANAKEGSEKKRPINDTLVVALAFQKQRFYAFSHVDPVVDQSLQGAEGEQAAASGSSTAAASALAKRDVFNEAPSAADPLHMDALQSRRAGGMSGKRLPTKAILRTTMGDIHIQLFSSQVPKTIENFAGHASSGYYNDVIFHRVIKGFMLQTGDPLGDGTGGESIWGGEFEDELVPGLRHDRPFTVSMANAGPNTNGSQFYITTVPTPWLDQKHTVFGRVVSGMDVCTSIENVKTDDLDKPLTEIRIVNVDLVE
jgi:peptidylprolyl isomerase domain and WD repeat-containing protein 1